MFWNTNSEVRLVARNMDIDFDDQPVFYVFPKGISKNGGVDVNPATWTSKYGSLVVTHLGSSTFRAVGRESKAHPAFCIISSLDADVIICRPF